MRHFGLFFCCALFTSVATAEVFVGQEKDILEDRRRAATRADFQEAEQQLRQVYAERYLKAKSRGSRQVVAQEYAEALSELKKTAFSIRKEWLADKRADIQSQMNKLEQLAQELAQQDVQRKTLEERRQAPLQGEENWRKSYMERLQDKRKD